MEKRAKSVELAIEEALKELNVTKDKVNIEIIEEGSKGFLGIGAKDAVVNVTLKEKSVSKPVQKPVSRPVEQSVDSPVQKTAETVSKPVTNGDPEAEAQKFLSDIFKAMDLDVEISTSMEDDTVAVELKGENMGIVIGKRGDTLDSLQYLTSLVVNQKAEDYIKVSIDTENYREKRAEALLSLSKRLAEKVEKTGRKFTLEPMNPYERRIIHSNLQENDAVTTYSIGQEPYRKVVIAPKNAKPAPKKSVSYNKSEGVTHKTEGEPRKNEGGYKRESGHKIEGDRYKRENTPRRPRFNSGSGRRQSPSSYKSSVADVENVSSEEMTPEKKGSYTTTYKADFKPHQHKAQYSSFEDYLAAQETEKKD